MGASFVVNKVMLQGIADYLGIGIDVASSWSSTSIVLAQIKQRLENLQEDVDVLLHKDLDVANTRFKAAIELLQGGEDSEAYKEMEKVIDKAIEAFAMVKKFEDKVESKRLSIFCRMMTLSYDKEKKRFLPLDKVPEGRKKMAAKLIFNDLTDMVAKFEDIKVPMVKKIAGWNKKKELEALNGLLRCTLPVIWHHLDVFCPDTWREGKQPELLKYLPEGALEDGAVIPFGGAGALTVWKSGDRLEVCCIFGKFKPAKRAYVMN